MLKGPAYYTLARPRLAHHTSITLRRRYVGDVLKHPVVMDKGVDYQNWSHQSLIDRVAHLEQQLKEQTEK